MDTETAIIDISIAERELELTAIRNALKLIDRALAETASTNIVPSDMMTDFFLDIRNILKPLLD